MIQASDLLRLYTGMPAFARLHAWLRWRLFDFPALGRYLPEQGIMLDIGCGHGLWSFYAALCRPQLQVWGIDPDEDKITLARHTAEAHRIANVRFVAGLAEEADLPPADLVTIIDVIYLIPPQGQERLLEATTRPLRPGGRLLLKELSERPRWKAVWNTIQESLSVRVFGITYGDRLTFRPQADWRDLLVNLGLTVQIVPMDEGYIYPHVLFIGEKT